MAQTTITNSQKMNGLQRLGGPTLTTVCATFLAWRMRLSGGASAKAFVAGFALLCGLQLPMRVMRPADECVALDAAAE